MRRCPASVESYVLGIMSTGYRLLTTGSRLLSTESCLAAAAAQTQHLAVHLDNL